MSGHDTLNHAVEEHQQRLIRYATRILGDRASATEMVQESFARLQEEVATSGTPPNTRAWLYRVVRNLSIDHLRRAARFSTPDDPDWMTRVASKRSDGDPSILAEQKEEQTMVLESLDRLPPRQREAVRLKFQEGLTYAEIGQITDQTITTVGWLLHEALATLRKQLVPVQ
jgi:RNA polymerase sigma-70 factor (ECF subfamily)